MRIVILAAAGVGGATMFGAVVGFLLRRISQRFSDLFLSIAAGIMLAAAILGLFLPAVESGAVSDLLFTIFGVFLGGCCMVIVDRFVPYLHRLIDQDSNLNAQELHQVLLFISAIAIHNLPEGLAAGVSFGTNDLKNALLISSGIAIQNFPEGMVMIVPMLSAGIRPRKTLLIAIMTGLVEVIGTFIGYMTVCFSVRLLPAALGFAGGTMLYVIADEMIPETHSHENGRSATFGFLLGFCMMLATDVLLG